MSKIANEKTSFKHGDGRGFDPSTPKSACNYGLGGQMNIYARLRSVIYYRVTFKGIPR